MAPPSAGSVPEPSDPRWQSALQQVVDEPARLSLHAQPIVNLSSGEVAGFEMLSRFTGPWAASPDRWFAAADVWGVNAQLQAAALRTALAARAALPSGTFLTVNVDPHLLTTPEVTAALASSADLDRLVLELTEHTQMPVGSEPYSVLNAVRAAGAMVAMDDAGTGYAGLSLLLQLRPQFVKLDRDLITGVDRDPVKRALVEVLGDLAGRMDSWIIAEGIETRDELDAVISLGAPLGQGWALARAAPDMTTELPDATARHIRATASRTSLQENVVSVMRAGINVGTDRDTAEVLLNHHGQACRVRVAGDTWAPAMLVAPTTTLADAARRAVAREDSHRFAPMVCTDSRGVVMGTVGIDDLLSGLSRSSSTSIDR